MKIKEFLALSDSDKVEILQKFAPRYYRATVDKGKCFICGRKLGAGFFCFGCHRLVCMNCDDKPQHRESCGVEDIISKLAKSRADERAKALREVVGWVNNHSTKEICEYQNYNLLQRFNITDWQAQLRIWFADQPEILEELK